jgi:signal transduction histidine kinase/CheY-like chemotaxis protein
MVYTNPVLGKRTGLLWLRAVTIQHLPHTLGFYLDITDRKRMEEDLERARMAAEVAAKVKSEFIANMSHEIRTPLNGVLSLSALLAEEEMPEDTHFMIRLIRTSGETLAKILDDVLDFSKIECGKLELENVPFSLRDAMEWAVELFRATAGDKHLWLKLSVDNDVPARLDGDVTRIRQVLANLISNAIKFTEEGSIDVEAGLAREGSPEGTRRIRIAVRDTGIGISADKLGRLFQSFSQVDASTNRRFGGSGLGLVISRRLVEMMGGTIRVTSRPDEGSTFEFDFVAGVSTIEAREPVLQRDTELGPMRILVAEDNPVNQIVIKRVLQKLGCSADIVPDGLSALRQFQTEQYDVVLMDIQMPGVDGLEASRRIRSLPAAYSRIPIVALTASATVENRKDCLAAGMDDYLSKPLAMDALQKILRRCKRSRMVAGHTGEEEGRVADLRVS